ncbi:MAG: AsmA-like C-terminal region-containing protein, partial [Deltaproteobacteria bacterium]|nr:AsmA-like C-terminal region-containing protein [Deltaproteobacteria bacterium]
MRGTIGQDVKGKSEPFAEVTIKTGKAPLTWIPSLKSLSVKDGHAKVNIKLKGSMDGIVSAEGKIIADGLRFSLVKADKKKEFSLPGLAVAFEAYYSDKILQIPSLRLDALDFSLSVSSEINLKDKSNPHMLLKVKSPFIALKTFIRIFPTPFLPQWIENRLFPMFAGGNVRVDLFSLDGTLKQFQNLSRPENADALSMKLAWRDLAVLIDKNALPFKEVTGELNIENGALLISEVQGGFGRSIVKQGALHINNLYRGDAITYDITAGGSFDLQDLMHQREVHLIPLAVRQRLKEFESVSGNLEARVRVRYKSGWDYARILSSDFRIKECSITHKKLLMPLTLDEAHIQIDGKGQPKFQGKGLWGNCEFDTSGSLDKTWKTGKASIVARGDLNRVISFFYQGHKLPVKFSNLVPCRISVSRLKDKWFFQGEVDLEGITVKTASFSLTPPGKKKRVTFSVNLRPGEKVYLNECRFLMGGSSLQVSGSYNLRDRDSLDVKVSTEKLSLEDLGVRFKKGGPLARGTLACQLYAHASLQHPLRTSVKGAISAEKLSFILNRLPSPISDCNLKVAFSGKETRIHSLKMKVGQSPVNIQGNLVGWDGLKGDLTISSDYLNSSDFVGKGFSPLSGSKKAEAHRFIRNTDIDINLKAVLGQWQACKCGPLEAEGLFRSGDFYITHSRLQIDHGFLKMKGYIKNGKEPDISFSSYIKTTRQPLEGLVQSLGFEDTLMEGLVTLEAVIHAKGKEKKDLISELTGDMNVLMEEGIVKKSRPIFQVLDFLSLQKIFKRKPPDLSKEGFYFESIGGHIVIDKGVLKTENLTIKSPVFNAVAKGIADLTKKEVDFDLGVQPLGTIDWIVSKIPIAGYILTGKEKSLLIYYFKVKGPWFEPEVQHIPLKNIGGTTIGFFKRLFLTPERLFKNLGDAVKEFDYGAVPMS